MRCFERKDEIWISGVGDYIYDDIRLSGIGNLEIHIKGNHIELNGLSGVSIKHNDYDVKGNVINVRKGDTVALNDYIISFFDDILEIEGLREYDKVNLSETNPMGNKLSDFPHYKRSPRVIYRIANDKIEIKAPPQKKTMSTGGILQMIIPTLSTLAFTLLMGFVLKRGPYIYMSIGMTVITAIFSIKNFITQRKEIKESNKKRDKVYKEYLLKTRKLIRKKRQEEREAIQYLYPEIYDLATMIESYSSRLYERSFMDNDFLRLTVGFYKGESNVRVTYEKNELDLEEDELKDLAKEVRKEYEKVDTLPLNIDLKHSHLGLVGDKNNIHEQLRYFLMQLTFFQSYHDLQVIILHNDAYRDVFSYTRWYPHMQIQSINMTGVVCTEQARDQVFGSIQQILKERKNKQEEENQDMSFMPHFLFIIDEPNLIMNHTVMEYLQSKELKLDFSFIYTTNKRENLPENVGTVCLLENSQDGRLLLNAGERVNRNFILQRVNSIDLEREARILSAIIHDQGMKSQIPESITFFDMYKIEHPNELDVKRRWSENQSHKSLAVPLGVRAKEDYVELNLHERAHGPHGLVAGTTGSGKSEIVQSYILSLAVNFHPYEVGFLLIDYKGGGMANLFSDLPHLLGTITNLDKAESMRAMASIKSELSRRQLIFGENNVNHINGYNKLFKLGKVAEPLPHLFLISDEFAELKKEQPEFMSELVSAARIGRSLGIHLILATQKPSGVVDDQIWTNSKFKLCLKVQNAGDSKEMIRTPDAANITQAGRAYLQVGNNEIYELFQSAWSGATYKKQQTEEEKEDDRVYLINEIGQGILVNQDLSGPKESNKIKDTQLDVVVSHIKEVYQSEETVEVKKPWLPSLSDMIASPYTMEVKDSAEFMELDTTLGLGIIDIPEEQDQREYVLDFASKGHLLYMASSGYGKSTVLGHIILGLSMKNSVKNLNIYIMDLGNSALIPYNGLPHVADYMGIDDSEKIGKFQKLILNELSERKKLLAKAMLQNFNVYNKSQDKKLKAIIIAIDNYDAITELSDGAAAFIQKVARDGASLGVYFMVTMTRENVMRGAIKGSFKERIAGFNFTSAENNSFIGRSQIQLSEEKRGRVLVKTDNINSMQLYTPADCEDDLIFNDLIKEKIALVAESSSERQAKKIPVLPEILHYDMLEDYPEYKSDINLIPVGIDIDSLEVKYLDIESGPAVIVGNPGMGRTNMIHNILKHIDGSNVYIFDSKKEDLRIHKEKENVTYANSTASAAIILDILKKEISNRETLYDDRTETSLSIRDFASTLPSHYVIIDVIQDWIEHIEEHEDIVIQAIEYGIKLIVSTDAKLRARTSKLMSMLLESTAGLVVGNIKDQNVFPLSGIKEENRKPEYGYHHVRGENYKIKLVEHR